MSKQGRAGSRCERTSRASPLSLEPLFVCGYIRSLMSCSQSVKTSTFGQIEECLAAGSLARHTGKAAAHMVRVC
jgi:hypothetical protein